MDEDGSIFLFIGTKVIGKSVLTLKKSFEKVWRIAKSRSKKRIFVLKKIQNKLLWKGQQ